MNALIHALKGKGQVRRTISGSNPTDIAAPAVVAYEVEVDALRSGNPAARRRELNRLLTVLTVLPFDRQAADRAARELRSRKKRRSDRANGYSDRGDRACPWRDARHPQYGGVLADTRSTGRRLVLITSSAPASYTTSCARSPESARRGSYYRPWPPALCGSAPIRHRPEFPRNGREAPWR